MSSIYSLDTDTVYKALLPPKKRKTNWLTWGKVHMKPIQWVFDLFFVTYADGFTGAKYDSSLTYLKGERVRYKDHSVYEAVIAVLVNKQPGNTSYWKKIQDVWIGLRERIKYNGGKMVLEYALNKWFETVFRYAPAVSDIYIVNNIIIVNQFEIAVNEKYSSFIPVKDIYAINGIPILELANNQNAFTIFVPLTVHISLAANNTDRDNVIRAFANQYVVAGIMYNISAY